MSWLRELMRRIGGLFGWPRDTRRSRNELDDEMRLHLDMLEADLRASGMDSVAARREARKRFGGLTQAAEDYAAQRTVPAVESFVADIRYGARMLRRTPLVTAAALITLALGIGANTAIFSVVHAVLFRPLPFAEPDRLVVFGDADESGLPTNMGFATWQDYRDRSRTFESMAMVRSWSPTLVVNNEAERIAGLRVSWNYFDMLGIRPALGRSFQASEDRSEQWRVVMISDGLWRRRFGGDPSIVGRTIRMNDRDYRVVGVLPASFEPLISQHFYAAAEIWAALGYDASLNYACRSCQHLRAVGRLRKGASVATAAAELDAIRAQLVREHPGEYAPGRIRVMRLRDKLAGPVRGAMLTLLAAVGFVLIIACANVANLLLARAAHRNREMALRAALGAARSRLVRQLMTESLLLAFVGGTLGLLLAGVSVRGLAGIAPLSIPRLERVHIDVTVLVFALALSIATGLLFGVLPARHGATPDLQQMLTSNSRWSAGRGGGARGALIAGDLALALVLLTGAGLMVKSVIRLSQVNPGFDARGVLTLQYSLIGEKYAEDSAVLAFTEQLVTRIEAVPGVEAVAGAGQIPMGGNGDTRGFHIEGRIPLNTAESPAVELYSVTPAYLRTMRIPLERGRFFTDADRASTQPVMVISESTARALFPGEDPIGHRVRIGDAASGPWRTIIGVAGDVRHTGLDAPPTMQMYLPQAQATDSFLVLAIRVADAHAERVAGAVRAILRELDPAVPVYDVATLEDLVSRSVAQRRFVLRLLTGFAAVALLLAAVGLYGVVSHTVALRTRELGIRVALGASARDIMRLVLGSGLTAIVAGIATGVAIALVAVRFMKALLFDVDPADPGTLALAAAVLGLVALAAHAIPIYRAVRIDPTVALRQE